MNRPFLFQSCKHCLESKVNQFGVFVGDYITNSLTNGLEMINQTAQRAEKEVSFEKSSEISSSLIRKRKFSSDEF